MLRRIYFVNLLICVKFIFCYDRIPAEHRSMKFIHRKYRDGIRREFGDITRKYDSDLDRESAHIDLASFIQNPDIENDHAYRDINEFRENAQNEYSNYGSIDDNLSKDFPKFNYNAYDVDKSRNKKHEKLKIDDPIMSQSYSMKNAENKDYSKTLLDLGIDQNLDHLPSKKCVLKNMKIPFFSHKTGTEKAKKNKKRKLFQFHSFRKGNTKTSSTSESTLVKVAHVETTPDSHQKLLKRKRSYYERLCPACKQKFIERYGQQKRENIGINMIHNGRQYYKITDS